MKKVLASVTVGAQYLRDERYDVVMRALQILQNESGLSLDTRKVAAAFTAAGAVPVAAGPYHVRLGPMAGDDKELVRFAVFEDGSMAVEPTNIGNAVFETRRLHKVLHRLASTGPGRQLFARVCVEFYELEPTARKLLGPAVRELEEYLRATDLAEELSAGKGVS